MEVLLTPKKLAEAIGVSESSLKRWSDDGLLQAARTVGGHRRITLSEAVRFIRQTGAQVIRPELLGLHEVSALDADWFKSQNPGEALYVALEAGNATAVRGMLQSLYLSGKTMAWIFDEPLRDAMARIGQLWLHAEWGLVVEHRATNIAIQAISQMRSLIPPRTESGPVAVGAAAESDAYILPSLMASMVLADAGFADVNLGPLTPTRVLRNASLHYHARVVWLTVSVTPDIDKLIVDILRLADELEPINASLVVGGRGMAGVPAAKLPGVLLGGSMSELGAFATGLLTALPPGPTSPLDPRSQPFG
jgi:hypothetical protein